MSFIEFGRYVKVRREELGLTQDQLAERVGISLQSISMIETAGVSDMKASNLFKLASVLKWDGYQVYRAFHGKDPYTGPGQDKAPKIKKAIKAFLARLAEIESEGL